MRPSLESVKMAKEQVKGHTRTVEGRVKTVKKYSRKKRGSPGGKRIVSKKLIRFKPRVVRFKPRRPVRDVYGQIRGYG